MQTLANSEVRDLVNGSHRDPFAVLGPHALGDGSRWVVRALLPGAQRVEIVAGQGERLLTTMDCLHEGGLFAAELAQDALRDYRFAVVYPQLKTLIDDAYRFPSLIRETDLYLFHEGRHENAWQCLGANLTSHGGVTGVLFSVWAPNASRVAVVGEFNHWNPVVHGMRLHPGSGVWELFIPGISSGARYKFSITATSGRQLPLKSDPYAQAMETAPGTASLVAATADFEWGDADWMAARPARQAVDSPVSIYELHLGSWRRSQDGKVLNYRALAEQLIPYIREMAFTHVQIMPIHSHPFGGSWGYQPIGLFAPTAMYGDADALRYLIDLAHRNDIGVLLDWVPGHFPMDEHGLGEFDGTHLYEHADPRQGFHQDWKTYIYNYDRPEVVSYLLSNALYWLAEFHIDGLRVDAVASMLYLDYSREDGEWLPNQFGGRENLGAIDLLKLVNSRAYGRFPGIMMIAEESTAWPGVTKFVDHGGLGFGYKWNLGWMNDTLKYMHRDPIHRQYHAGEMTFGLVYAFSENFILPISHDEVVHGKRSLLEKMPGDNWQKFANMRAYLGFMWGHPGKNLLFMGCEFAQRDEWRHDRSIDWHLLEFPPHQGVHQLVKDLNAFYLENAALWLADYSSDGFEWLAMGDGSGATIAFMRSGGQAQHEEQSRVLVVCNFTPSLFEDYTLGVPGPGNYRERLNTDSRFYGGSDKGNPGVIAAQAHGSHGQDWSINLTLPPLATLFFTIE
jgi:1,4-alpha-glucan branching enzyme